ncbi:MAG TPA: glycogen/starch synthase [Candidatus Limnocylindrales bacterium]|nr:glycogen/starch synthase [Candidatus Limnocylindrales bacterium]
MPSTSPTEPMRVAFIAAECEPWAKTGGLADVVDALARSLAQCALGAPDGIADLVDVYIPNYRDLPVPPGARSVALKVPDPLARSGSTDLRLLISETHGYRLHLVDHPAAFDRDGMYGPPGGGDHPDNAWRFALLCRAALEHLRGGGSSGTSPDVIHIHDWHAAPAALLRETVYRDDPAISTAALLLTVHNLAYHGWTPTSNVHELGLPADALAGVRPRDGIDLLRAGITRADLVNTVSPGFAAEALTPEFGMGLDGDLRAKGDRFFGILNGLDTDLWDPATDAALPAGYSRENRYAKAACRRGLLEELDLDASDDRPVLAMIGRLDRQKGFDLLASAAPSLLLRGFRLAILGTGSPEVVAPLRLLAGSPKGRGRIALVDRFDRDLARRMYAGSDGFVMPSRFEPCGTGQMIALRYGTPPIVRATGGLKDTVIDEDANPGTGTGFVFEGEDPQALVDACLRFDRHRSAAGATWNALLDRGMSVDFDWRSSSAPAYLDAYRRAIDLRRVSSR